MQVILIIVFLLLGSFAIAEEPRPRQAKIDSAIDRGISFLQQDALAWKKEHNCVSCHHAALVVWAMREARQQGHPVDEHPLNDLARWLAESGDGKTSLPRPEGIPKALNAKAVWFALALAADNEPDAATRQELKLLRMAPDEAADIRQVG
jgi:hypothetical protein